MRAFIAIGLSQETKERLALLQQKLKPYGDCVKWVEPKNIHLTLKFLGEIDEKKSEKISSIMDEVACVNTVFAARISSIGAFPKIDYPRVIWVGIDKGDKESVRIAEGLEEKIARVGIAKEKRKFSSHITIGRVRPEKKYGKLAEGLKDCIRDFEKEWPEFEVKNITLFKSTLTPTGPIYEILKEASLATS